MVKEMPVILVNKVADMKRKIGKRRAKEEVRHKGSLTHQKINLTSLESTSFENGIRLQGDQMSLRKSRPKCNPTHFCQN
jgi:hypothetical protein